VNKAQLVEAIADKMGGRQNAADAVDAVLDAIVRAVVSGDRVSVTGFGSFEKVDRPARYARNPQTGERVRVKKTSVPRFRAGQGFKDLVSGSKKLPRGGEVAVKKAPKGSLQMGAATKKAAAKKAAAKKAPAAKKAAPAKKAPAKKAPAAKKAAPAKKAPAKKAPAAKKAAPAKKAPAKKAPARKATAKKAPARKTTARKTTAKKTAAK
jgi:DNA-binding protein HU-beta